MCVTVYTGTPTEKKRLWGKVAVEISSILE